MTEITLISAFVLGLMGSGHCMAMCGGIISSLSMATGNHNKWLVISVYQFGRIFSYTLFGFVAGWLGGNVEKLSMLPVLKILSGTLLILMGFYISRVWMIITYMEKLGKLVWNQISPLSKHLLPVKSARQAMLLGALWGWLPCGLVYTALGYSLTTASPAYSSLFMLAFGLGTLPATITAGAASTLLKKWLNLKAVRLLTGFLFILYGSYTLYTIVQTGEMPHHHHH